MVLQSSQRGKCALKADVPSYDILRHNGLPIGKRDFMGAY
jgi:hypothetical protein